MIKHICTCGNENIDIMSVVEDFHNHNNQKIPYVKITYVCPNCGCGDYEESYLYKKEMN